MTTPYRDDREALQERLSSLEGELSRVRETLGSLSREQKSAERLEKEIATLRAQIEAREKKPALEGIRIAAPCSADWGSMVGNDRVRFCPSCAKNVYNLSALSRPDAERLLAENGDKPPCVRLYKRRDGTVITNDCPVGVRRRRFRRIVVASVGGGLLAAGAMLARWRTQSCMMMTQGEMVMPVARPAPDRELMGVIARPTPETPSALPAPSTVPSATAGTPVPAGSPVGGPFPAGSPVGGPFATPPDRPPSR